MACGKIRDGRAGAGPRGSGSDATGHGVNYPSLQAELLSINPLQFNNLQADRKGCNAPALPCRNPLFCLGFSAAEGAKSARNAEEMPRKKALSSRQGLGTTRGDALTE